MEQAPSPGTGSDMQHISLGPIPALPVRLILGVWPRRFGGVAGGEEVLGPWANRKSFREEKVGHVAGRVSVPRRDFTTGRGGGGVGSLVTDNLSFPWSDVGFPVAWFFRIPLWKPGP